MRYRYEVFYDDGKGSTQVVSFSSQEHDYTRVAEEFERMTRGARVLEIRQLTT